MIKETFYKDRPAVEISNGKITAKFLPLDGAKIASIKDEEGMEFLAQAKGEQYRVLGVETNYIDAECSSFDDMFPTIDPCEINSMQYLDHGESTRREHQFEIQKDSVKFTCTLDNLNILYEKTAYFEGDALAVKYTITNKNDFDFPYLWAGHMMFAGELGSEVVSEFENKFEKEVMFGQAPEKPNALGAFENNKQWKFYYIGAITPFECAIKYPLSKKRVNISFDNQVIKYLGLWMNEGFLNGMYNVAVEPCSALYDAPNKAKETCSFIPAGDKIEFTLKINIEKERK
ncbi:MAG: hypothetical protein IKB86_04175 [Clostridia bacterium]|nr:hypothetical protein [Clostridia bacterium]